jgi:hypothetical protein
MSESFSIYIVDEDLLPTELLGMTDEEIHGQITSAIETNGKLHQVIEMTEDDFVDALDAIDTLIEGNGALPNGAMNNTPNQLLDKSSECPFIGYFEPGQVQKLFYMFEALSEDSMDVIESVETHSEVFEAFRSALSDALDFEQAIAVLHA